MTILIRSLEIASDLCRVVEFYAEAPDYWPVADGSLLELEKAKEFFEDIPPNCNPNEAHRLGIFFEKRLSGIANLSFGFPEDGNAYIGLMMLGTSARNQGTGKSFLSHLENLARAGGAKNLCLAIMTINQKGRIFGNARAFQQLE